MGADRLAGPIGAFLGSGVVADGEDEIEVRGVGRGKFIPAFGAGKGGIEAFALQQRYGKGVGLTGRARPGGKPLKPAFAQTVHHSLGQNGTGGIAGA